MDAADLKVFEAVARLGGMNRAAVELHTVQSNVTARIQALEADIGSMLLERHSRGVSLTQAGQRLLPYADKVARLLDDARRAARDDGAPRGVLTIGSLETTAALRLTPLLDALCDRQSGGRSGAAHRHHLRAGRRCAGTACRWRVRVRAGGAPGARRADDVQRGTGRAGGARCCVARVPR